MCQPQVSHRGTLLSAKGHVKVTVIYLHLSWPVSLRHTRMLLSFPQKSLTAKAEPCKQREQRPRTGALNLKRGNGLAQEVAVLVRSQTGCAQRLPSPSLGHAHTQALRLFSLLKPAWARPKHDLTHRAGNDSDLSIDKTSALNVTAVVIQCAFVSFHNSIH